MSSDNNLIVRNAIKITLLFILFAIFSYFFLDKEIAMYFHKNSLSHKKGISLLSHALSPIANLVCWPALFFLVRILYKKEILGNRILLICLSLACTNLASSTLKVLLGRVRPEMLFLHDVYGFQFFGTGDLAFSFPSAHACTLAAILGSLACLFPKRAFSFAILAISISFVRVMKNHHFVSDVLVGCALGFAISPFVFLQMKKNSYPFST